MTTPFSIKPVLTGLGLTLGGAALTRALPEPRPTVVSLGAEMLDSGMDAIGGVMAGGGSELTELLNVQLQIQREMQVVSMTSNVLKSQHEMEMAPIRNMRVG
jgi:hypothetical protein